MQKVNNCKDIYVWAIKEIHLDLSESVLISVLSKEYGYYETISL